ncbi:thioredoxin [Xylophilus sp.]|uniref:thioredoxin n=1 Tax=Xylophilus sp. TaxID=2653893 RepID=UPI0013B81940|nr:thioredoxin [Xylophilus sp.]KAF1043729.1 MAG: Thioredoxin [Xylophilus sp.]
MPLPNPILCVTDASFEEDVLRPPGILLLDFWAPWCAPCRLLAPLLEELAAEYAGGIRVAKINADANAAAVERLAVRSLPTLILWQDGVERERVLGLSNKSRLAAMLDRYLED